MLAPQSAVNIFFRIHLFRCRIAIVHFWTCHLHEPATEIFWSDNWKSYFRLWAVAMCCVNIYVSFFFLIIWEIICFYGVLIKRLLFIQKGCPNVLSWADWGCWVWMIPSARRNVTSQVMDSYVNYILVLWPVIFRKNKYVKIKWNANLMRQCNLLKFP